MTIQLALIGTGSISRRHIIAMRDLKIRGKGDFEVTAICDAKEENVMERADQCEELLGLRPRVYTDYHELLEKETVDAADLCLPHGMHHGVAIDCMDAGIHVVCEKPLGVTIKACRLMAEASERTGRILATAAPHRFQPGQRTARWVINESGLIGEPRSFFHHYTRPPAPSPWSAGGTEEIPDRVRWRQNQLMSGGGPVLDSGFHYCDTLCHLFGELDTVYAQLATHGSATEPFPHGPEDTTLVTFRFKNGVTGSWTWSLAAPGESAYNVVFFGSEGSLRDTTGGRFSIFHLFERTLESHETGLLTQADGTEYSMAQLNQMHLDTLSAAEQDRLYPGGADDGFAIEIWDFLEVVRGNRDKPEIDPWTGLNSLAVGDAIYESAITGEVIAYDDIVSGKRSTFQDPINAHWGI